MKCPLGYVCKSDVCCYDDFAFYDPSKQPCVGYGGYLTSIEIKSHPSNIDKKKVLRRARKALDLDAEED